MTKPMVTPPDWGYEDGECRMADDLGENWIQTFTGRQFFPFRPQDSEIVVEDIAHALSMTCRFTGHCLSFYSVAQHCVLASHLVPQEDALWALLHDAGEAYLCDLPSPIKPGIPRYKEVEHSIEVAIFKTFGLEGAPPASVKHADLVLVATEARDLMANPPTMWRLPVPPLAGMTIDPWGPEEAERQFLKRFEELTR